MMTMMASATVLVVTATRILCFTAVSGYAGTGLLARRELFSPARQSQ